MSNPNVLAAPTQPGLMERVSDAVLHTRAGRAVAAGLAGLTIAAAENLVNGDAAEAQATTPNTVCTVESAPINGGTLDVETCKTTKITTSIAGMEVKASDVATGKIKVLSNIGKAWSKKKIAKAEAKDDCMLVGKGTKNPKFLNQGFNVSNKKDFGVDTRRSKICWEQKKGGEVMRHGKEGRWVRVLCDNEVKLIFVPSPVKTIFVANKLNAKLTETAKASVTAKAKAQCDNGTSAEGSGSASASAKATSSIKAFVKTRGKSSQASRLSVEASASATAKAQAVAKASATCSTSETTTITTTPPPPPSHSCSINTQEQKGDGLTWNLGVTDDGAQTTGNWKFGDGTQENNNTDSTVHKFPGYKTFRVSYDEKLTDGGTAHCEVDITPVQSQTPPPPPAS